jgi:hypothetical protein
VTAVNPLNKFLVEGDASRERCRAPGTGRVDRKSDSRMQTAEEGRNCVTGSRTLDKKERREGIEAGEKA